MSTKGQKRDPVLVLILGAVTCGIYGIIWNYGVTDELKRAVPKDELNPALDLVLGLVTCGLYFLWVAYRNGQLIAELHRKAGFENKDFATLGLILAFFFFPAMMMIYQQELNRVWEKAPGI